MNIAESTKAGVKKLLANNRKIEAIKLVREATGLSLKDALLQVEMLESNDERKIAQFRRPTFPVTGAAKPDRVFSIVSKAFLGVGLLLLAIGMALAYDTDQKIAHSQRVEGRVVGFADRSSGYRPVVAYTFNGKALELEGSVSSNPPLYDIGEEVGIYVPNDKSTTPFIDSIAELWISSMILGGLGAIFSLIGVGLLYASRKF